MGVARRVVLASLVAFPAFALGVLGAAGACSSTTVKSAAPEEDASGDAGEDAPPLEPVDAAPAECKIVPGASTGDKVCDDCLQKNCCVVINTCLNDKECDALNTCIAKCGMRLGMSDAGVQCVKQCIAARPGAKQAVEDFFGCEAMRCDTECK